MGLKDRYADAYFTARVVDVTGKTVKFMGLGVAVVIAIGGFILGSKVGTAVGFGGLLLGALVALPFYALGVLVSAQGQILKATLDTAVNSSPLLTHDEVRQILREDEASQIGRSEERRQRSTDKPDGRCPNCNAPFWYADYREDAPALLCTLCKTEIPRPTGAAQGQPRFS